MDITINYNINVRRDDFKSEDLRSRIDTDWQYGACHLNLSGLHLSNEKNGLIQRMLEAISDDDIKLEVVLCQNNFGFIIRYITAPNMTYVSAPKDNRITKQVGESLDEYMWIYIAKKLANILDDLKIGFDLIILAADGIY